MKCLSLWQPWASLLASGHKKCETRGWPIRHRGPLLIHAAKTWNASIAGVCRDPVFAAAFALMGVKVAANRNGFDVPDLPFGSIVGRVDVVGCVETKAVRVVASGPTGRTEGGLLIGTAEAAFGDYSAGRFAFVCANPVLFDEPIPFRGAQGLFDVPDDLLPNLPPRGHDLGGEG